MNLSAEERVIYERDVRRCQAEAERLRQLSGNTQRRIELGEAWAPLLRTPPIPEPVCRLPYFAPDLLP
jgi:hypothetical protein